MSPSPLRLYSHPRCSTCRRALRWLEQQDLAVEVHDITLTPPSVAELQQAWASLNPPTRLFNTSGQRYRALGAATARAMTAEQAVAALAADGLLIRRPLLIRPDSAAVLVGFDPLRWAEVLLESPG